MQCEVLEDLLTLNVEEATNFLYSALLLEQFSILKLRTVLRVVAHEVLSQEDARVESGSDTGVDFICRKGNGVQIVVQTVLYNTYLDSLCL